MYTHKRAKALLEKIGVLTHKIEKCISELNTKELDILRENVSSLYLHFGEYTKAWDYLNKSLFTESFVNFENYLDSNDFNVEIPKVKNTSYNSYDRFMDSVINEP